MTPRETLGVYINFPSIYHGVAQLEFNTSLSNLQKAVLNALYRLNGCSLGGYLSDLIESNLDVIVEFGAAEGLTFNYLDLETLEIFLHEINRRESRVLDFFCVFRYYALKNGVKRALRFDYYFLRFFFNRGEFEIQIFHEKGLQRVSIEDLIKLLTDKINLELAQEGVNPVKIKYMHTV